MPGITRKTALVLGAGGGFGAYQAGAWSVFADILKPDVIVGASVGSLNGWAIAGGMPIPELLEFWRTNELSARLKFRFARPSKGLVDGSHLEQMARHIFDRYPPKIEYGAVATEWRTLQPRLFRTADMTWRHLYGSCAIPLIFEQQTFGNRLHSDGGLLCALPVWAAAEFAATHVIAIDVWQVGLARLQKYTPYRKLRTIDADVTVLTPSEPLGSAWNSLFWKREQIDWWIALGAADARRLVERGDLEALRPANLTR